MRRIQRTISDFIVDGSAPTVGPGDMVGAAVEVMKRHDANYVVVLEDDRLVGIFTERDYLNRVMAARREPDQTEVRDVMTSDPVTLSSEDCVSYAINQMAVGGFRNVPIVDPDGTFLTVITVRDVIGHLSDLLAEAAGSEEDMQEWTDIGGG